MGKCERCGFEPAGYALNDYCAECGAELCKDCMQKGHCGHKPALSGMALDCDEQEEVTPETLKARLEQDRIERDALKAA